MRGRTGEQGQSRTSKVLMRTCAITNGGGEGEDE